MTTTFPITKWTGYACADIPNSSAEASTFHTYRMRLDKVAVVAEAIDIIEEDLIRYHYELMPKRTIADLARAYDARLARQSHKKYIDIELPMIDDGEDW
jgi:hypothetical protein